jgi:LysM repeat protein
VRLNRKWLARLGAPVAFLLGVTIAVLLIRAGLEGGSTRTSTLGAVTQASTARVPKPARTVTGARTSLLPGVSTNAAGEQFYTVRKGDTFGSIAAKAGTTVSALEALNPGVSSNALQVGQKIRVK